MANSNRYKLVYHYNNGGEKLFEIDFEDGRHKNFFMLTEIDALTWRFSNDEELAKVLKFVSGDFNDGYFVIEYNSHGIVKTMEVLFNDIPSLGKLALEHLGESSVSKEEASYYMDEFLKLIEDEKFLKFILSHRYTNSYFGDALNYYLRLKNSDEIEAQSMLWEAKAKLKKEFNRYKTIRGIEIGKKNYKLLKENKMLEERGKLTVLQRARIEHELNHPKKVQRRKPKKNKVLDGQIPLFDGSLYERQSKRTKR